MYPIAHILRRVRYATPTLPGTGGLFKAIPDDFFVEELPAYPPSGEGDHTFVFLQKRGLTTDEAVQRVCRALEVDPREAGAAGQKDRQAVTRQWISLPRVAPERALGLSLPDVQVLSAVRHGHKLRTGHLTGNRFRITLRGTTDGVARATAILGALAKGGVPNRFGPQRFGARGDNAARGRALLDGTLKGRVGRSERRLLISAYQSALFNRYLERRFDDGLLSQVTEGDVLQKTDSGGLFLADPAELPALEQRLREGAIVVTGPMFGHKMMAPPEGSPSGKREAALLEEEQLTTASFASAGKLAEGTRRPLLVPVSDAGAEPGPEPDAVLLAFALPPGAYATVVLGEVMKPQGDEPARNLSGDLASKPV